MIVIGTQQELEKLKDIITCPYINGDCPGVNCWDCFTDEHDIKIELIIRK